MAEYRKEISVAVTVAVVVVLALAGISFYSFPSTGPTVTTKLHDFVMTTGPTCPNIFANVTYYNETGFVTVSKPSPTSVEFVLAPSTTAQLTAVFSSESNDISQAMVNDTVPVWLVNLNNGSYTHSSEVTVTVGTVTAQSNHEVTVDYAITSAGSDGLYLIGIPSTCYGVWVNIGTTPYVGTLP